MKKRLHEILASIDRLSEQELHHLLNHLNKRPDILLPKCYTRGELLEALELEGLVEQLTDDEFNLLKREFNNGCQEFLCAALRTKLMVLLDQTKEKALPA
jgi:hypothetical protein